jgi:putative membrane protein
MSDFVAGGDEPYERSVVDERTPRIARGSRWVPAVRSQSRVRPTTVFDEGLQHERTALAWERTAIAAMVAGALLARYASSAEHFVFASVGVAMVACGSVLLVWSSLHYDDLHGPLRAGQSPVHPTAARRIGWLVIGFTGCALVLSIILVFE